MFSKTSTNKLPKRIEFSLNQDDFLKDIEAVSKDEEERRKLYVCIDGKMPAADIRFTKMEEFLKGNVELEGIVETLRSDIDELKTRRGQLQADQECITQLLNVKSKQNSV